MTSDNKKEPTESINDLIDIVAKLRDPEKGCPWDLKQTHSSLIPFVLEEAYEVADAIRTGTSNELKEELGDLLLQIILHAQIAKEEKQFSLSDIAQEICKKLIRRHPHVFQNSTVASLEEINTNWEYIKSKEKPLKATNSPISDTLRLKVRSQSAISGSLNISKKVTKVGFKWQNIEHIWKKLNEELDELKQALNTQNQAEAQAEFGDVIFTLVNIAHWYNINPEEGLAGTNQKILDRFSFIEEKVNGQINCQSNKQLQNLWQEAKDHLSSKG